MVATAGGKRIWAAMGRIVFLITAIKEVELHNVFTYSLTTRIISAFIV